MQWIFSSWFRLNFYRNQHYFTTKWKPTRLKIPHYPYLILFSQHITPSANLPHSLLLFSAVVNISTWLNSWCSDCCTWRLGPFPWLMKIYPIPIECPKQWTWFNRTVSPTFLMELSLRRSRSLTCHRQHGRTSSEYRIYPIYRPSKSIRCVHL